MSEFEDYIKARYPVDYDSLKEKYPNVHVCEFYGDEQDLWDLKQTEIEQLKAKNEKTQKQFNFLLDKNIRDESAHATLKLKLMKVSRLVGSLRSEFDLWSDSPPVERQIELLEEIIRGEHE